MKHSIIFKVGDNIIYQHAQEKKPVAELTSSPVEFNRALPEWEKTSRSYIIKPSDVEKLGDLITPQGLNEGIQIDYEKMEIYPDGNKKYARFAENPDRSLVPELVVKNPTQLSNPQMQGAFVETNHQQKEPKGMSVMFEIDDAGEPMLIIPNSKALLPIEQKLFASFIMKAIRDEITLEKAEDGGCTIKIKEKK